MCRMHQKLFGRYENNSILENTMVYVNLADLFTLTDNI